MPTYVLDTDTLVLLQQSNSTVVARMLAVAPTEIFTTVINVEEQLRGWYSLVRRAKQPPQIAHAYQRLADTVKVLGRMQILSFDEPPIEKFRELKSLKLRVKHMDLRIAAIALCHGGVLVTRNVRDFVVVPNLVIEDWSR
jgi:tRNA(fMet)-specific endonuclease VapC